MGTIIFLFGVFVLYLEWRGRPPVYPERVAQAFGSVVVFGTLLVTQLGRPIIPTGAPLPALIAPLILLSLAPPLIGRFEARRRPDGQGVFADSRFRMHLVSNLFGALAASAFIWAALSTIGLVEYIERPRADYVANVALPLAWMVVRAFVGSEQEKARVRYAVLHPDDQHPAADDAVKGWSLKRLFTIDGVVGV